MATRNCNGPSAFRSLRNSLKNSKWCAFRRTSAKLLKTWRQKLGERKGWWPWIQLQLGNGECISQAVGPVAMCEEQGEWIGYSAYFLGDKLKLSYIHPKAGPIIWQLQWKRRSILKRIIFSRKPWKFIFYIIDSKQPLLPIDLVRHNNEPSVIDQYFYISFANSF